MRRAASAMPTRSSSARASSRARRRLQPRWMRSGSATWSPTRCKGLSAAMGSWNTMAMRLPRRAHRALSPRPTSSCPPRRMLPLTLAPSGSRPISASAVSDLPQPDSPIRPSVPPAVSEKSMPRTVSTMPYGVASAMRRLVTSSNGSCMVLFSRLITGARLAHSCAEPVGAAQGPPRRAGAVPLPAARSAAREGAERRGSRPACAGLDVREEQPPLAAARSMAAAQGVVLHLAKRGSRRSRRPSPSRFKPSTAQAMAAPGHTASSGAWCIKVCASASIRPQDGCGGCVPRPR